MPQKTKIKPKVRKIQSGFEDYSAGSQEYINALEMSVGLLQQEVDNLRQQLNPQTQNLSSQDSIKSPEVSPLLFNELATTKEIITKLHETIVRKYDIIESNIFFYKPNKRLEAVSPAETETTLSDSLKRLVEGGIIDWAVERKKPGIIPNIIDYKENKHLFFIIIPLFLRENPVGIFFALTSRDASFFDEKKLSEISTITGYAAIAIDNIRSLGEISGLELRLSALNSQMIHSAKLASIGSIATSFSQEILGPIKIIEANIQLLESGVGDSSRRYQIINEQLKKIEEISKRLELLAPFVTTEEEIQPVDIKLLIDEVLLFSGTQLQRDGILVNTDYDTSPCQVNCSKPQLEQVFLNLLLRSRDDMPDGGTIGIGVYKTERNKILLNITDSGYGIPDGDSEKIFDPSYQRADGKWTFGLFIIKNIIKQHGGRITSFSESGKGTTVKIVLPEYVD